MPRGHSARPVSVSRRRIASLNGWVRYVGEEYPGIPRPSRSGYTFRTTMRSTRIRRGLADVYGGTPGAYRRARDDRVMLRKWHGVAIR